MILIAKSLWLGVFCMLLFAMGYGQKDSTRNADTIPQAAVDTTVKKDSIRIQYIPVLPKTYQKADAWFMPALHPIKGDTVIDILKDYNDYFTTKRSPYQLYISNDIRSKNGPIFYKIEQRFSLPDKDVLYYLIIGILFMYGIINIIFPQYYPKLFSQFRQSSLRMVQNREQLVQNTFASLTSNINFILSFSLMSTLLIFNRHLLPISFWLAFLYVCIFFLVLYVGKYIILQLVGYVFNVKELVNNYVFVVFLINKILGVLLFPFILIMAFSKPAYYSFAIGGAAILTILLFLYRYLFSLTSVRNKLHTTSFHFFLYLCAFEILPLLILYKIIVQYFGGTY